MEGIMSVEKYAEPVAITRSTVRPAEPISVRSRELDAVTVLVTAVGEVDAATAAGLFGNVERQLCGYRQLVLDLSGLEFFGTAGYAVLQRLHSWCARTGRDWVLVPGREVRRLLRVCDPDGVLPTAATIAVATATLTHDRSSQAG